VVEVGRAADVAGFVIVGITEVEHDERRLVQRHGPQRPSGVNVQRTHTVDHPSPCGRVWWLRAHKRHLGERERSSDLFCIPGASLLNALQRERVV